MGTAIKTLDAPETIYTAVDAPFEAALLPDPDLDVSEWADEYRVLSRASGATSTSPTTTSRRCWRAEGPGDGETAGFWLNGLYSPWTPNRNRRRSSARIQALDLSTWGQLAKDSLRARKSPERMRTFTNTVLAETFQQAGTMKTDASELLARRQPYRPEVKVPAAIFVGGRSGLDAAPGGLHSGQCAGQNQT